MPISNDATSDDSYYFWLWGKDSITPSRDLVIWLQGGPDCSSLMGMLAQNGPFIFPKIDGVPHPNAYTWTRSANILYVEQPIGNGFTTGRPTSQTHAEFAKQFGGFLDNFFKTFPELNGSNIYFAGESYAGSYISHIMNYQYTTGNKHTIKGALIINGLLSDPVVQTDLVAYEFAVKNAKTIGLTKGDLAVIKKQSDQCHYTSYTQDHLKYPASGPLPDIYRHGCDTFKTFDSLARKRKADYNTCELRPPPDYQNFAQR
jgi:carboxypeptidase D